jgi:hypothetical protein
MLPQTSVYVVCNTGVENAPILVRDDVNEKVVPSGE